MEGVMPRKSNNDLIEDLLLKVKALVFSLLHLKDLFQVVKLRDQHEGIQLKTAEIIKIFQAIRKFGQCKMLVFGLGNDSPFWCSANGKGPARGNHQPPLGCDPGRWSNGSQILSRDSVQNVQHLYSIPAGW